MLAGICTLFLSCSIFEPPQSEQTWEDIHPLTFPGTVWTSAIASNAEVHPESDKYIAKLKETKFDYTPYILVEEGTFTVFESQSDTPRKNIPLDKVHFKYRGIRDVPLPGYAQPDAHTDSHIALIDLDKDLIFEFWQFHLVQGQWRAGNAAIFDRNGDGIASGISARASGFSLMAGAIWPGELLATNIEHALMFTARLTKKDEVYEPASYTDGWSEDPYALPMGARIRIKEDYDFSNIELDAYQWAVIRALKTYGAYLGDTGSFSFEVVNPLSFSENPYEDIPSYSKENKNIDLSVIPAEAFEVMTFGPSREKGSGLDFEEWYYE